MAAAGSTDRALMTNITACIATALIPGLPLLKLGKEPIELAQQLTAMGLSL